MKLKSPKYWKSKEYVSEIKKHLWHVWKTGITHSVCIDAFEEEEIAEKYTKFLNNELPNKN